MTNKNNINNLKLFGFRINSLHYLNPEGGLLDTKQDKRSKRMRNYLNQIPEVAALTNSPVAYFTDMDGGAELYVLAGMFRHIQVVGITDNQLQPKYSEKTHKETPSFMTSENFDKGSLEWSVAIYNRINSKSLTLPQINNILGKLHPEKGMFIGLYGTENRDGVVTTFFLNGTRNRTHYSETNLFEKLKNPNSHLKK